LAPQKDLNSTEFIETFVDAEGVREFFTAPANDLTEDKKYETNDTGRYAYIFDGTWLRTRS
jgi:hypothetical protein